LVVAVGNDRQFAGLSEAIGAPELTLDARFATNGARVDNRSALRDALELRLAGRTASDWAEELTQARVPAGVVNDVEAAFALAERLGLGPVVEVAREDGSEVHLTRNPIGLSRTPATYRSAPPRLPEAGQPLAEPLGGGPGGR